MQVIDCDGDIIGRVTTAGIGQQFPSLFTEKLRCIKGFEHRIQVKPEAKPVAHTLRRPPTVLEAKSVKELKNMECQNIIERIDSAEWVSPMVVVPKPGGDVRVCADLRDLNKNVVPNRFPMPTTDEVLTSIGGAKLFSVIDLKKAYFQVPLTKDSRHYTAFLTPIGLYQYCRLPMGYVSSGSVFQQLMNIAMAEIPKVIPLMDDILVYADSEDQHDSALLHVLKKLDEMNLTVSPQKMVIGQPSVKFNGHLLSKDGVQPLQSNVAAILDMPKPSNPKEMQTLLGMCGYYTRFVPHFSTVCNPLREAIRDLAPGQKLDWSSSMEAAFSEVKKHLSSYPILGYYKIDKPIIVTTDASAVGIGGALSQIQGNDEITVAFASRKLSDK
jgi:hypothetical protein